MTFERLKRSDLALAFWCDKVAGMKPGQRLDVSVDDLRDIITYEHNDAQFTPPDRILGNIMGSAFTHSFEASLDGRKVTFIRHENTGVRRYNEPDDAIRLRRLSGE